MTVSPLNRWTDVLMTELAQVGIGPKARASVKVLRAVHCPGESPGERGRGGERVAGLSAKSQHSPSRLVPSVFLKQSVLF